jgi:hypothetical protein
MAEALAVYIAEGLWVSYTTATVIAYAVVIAASVVVSQALASQTMGGDFSGGQSPNPGSRAQIPPAGDNKLPVVYGSAYVGGIITDLSISQDNQDLYFVVALSEVTNTENGGTPDVISFGDIYYGGKLVNFEEDGYTVASLYDASTEVTDTAVAGRIQIYLYNNGSSSPTNSSYTAIEIMQASNLVYQWDANKLMSNCAFAIIHLHYSQSANVTNLQQTRFKVINARTDIGDCIYDYMTSSRYGAALKPTQVDTASIDALNAYGNELISYKDFNDAPQYQARFKFDGAVDTKLNIMQNFQLMASSCDCLIRYNEINALWAVVVQSPSVDYVMDLNDSNMVSSITINPIDISNTFNVVECKYPDGSTQDSFASVTYDLQTLNPSLLFPNEPVNKQSISLYFVNNNVRVQLLANRFLKSAREDLQVQCKINYSGIQLEAGDLVTITNANYGWSAKGFRINKVTEEFLGDGMINASLNLSEYNPAVYDDASITQFAPAPNTGIGDPTFFGTLEAPYIVSQYPTATNPNFVLQVRTSTSGITQYAEIWYSAFSNPLQEQMYFAGTSEIQSSGNPWATDTLLPNITLTNIPAGNWYFFSRMVNSLASSVYSPHSTLLEWRPSTYQYSLKYLNVAYADDINGGGFDLNPRGHTYYGLHNTSGTDVSTNPADYTWYLAPTAFNSTGSLIYLLYSNRTGRKFSFSTGFAAYAANTGSFVPTSTVVYDPSIWLGLPDGTNNIDLDQRTGQLIATGTTTVGTGEIAITNNNQGNIVASLQQYLDFGGAYTKTSAVANLTIDIYGRVVGFETPDDFNYTQQIFTATSGQTVFTVTRGSGYIAGNCWVMQNGCLLDSSEYTDTSGSTGTVTLSVGATTGDIITITSFKSVNSGTGVYSSFSRNSATLTNQATYTASGFTLNTGFELLFLNGTVVNAQDYDISGQDITFVGNTSGDLQVIQWTPNNLGVANGTPVNVDAFTVIGQTIYPFSFNANAFNLFSNGVLFKQGTDYTTATGTFTLSNTPDNITTIMVQQTFARTGAV